MATVEDLEARVSALEGLLPTLATKKDVDTVKGEIIGKVDALEGKVDENHKAVMDFLESISKRIGQSPNY